MTYAEWLGTKYASPGNVQNAPNGMIYFREVYREHTLDYAAGGIDAPWIKAYGLKHVDHVMIECNEPAGCEYDKSTGKIKIFGLTGTEAPATIDLSDTTFRVVVWGRT